MCRIGILQSDSMRVNRNNSSLGWFYSQSSHSGDEKSLEQTKRDTDSGGIENVVAQRKRNAICALM